MTTITLDEDRDGYDGFPPGFRIVGRDDTGDALAVDAHGKVWSFAHGAGNWDSRQVAFHSLAQLHDYVAFQANLALPEPEESADALRARKARVEAFAKANRGVPFLRDTLAQTLHGLREEIAHRRFWNSRRGRNLTERQNLGKRCEEALRAAGVPGEWMIRAHADRDRALVAMGTYAAPWTEARVEELLRPLLGKFELVCRERPQPRSE